MTVKKEDVKKRIEHLKVIIKMQERQVFNEEALLIDLKEELEEWEKLVGDK